MLISLPGSSTSNPIYRSLTQTQEQLFEALILLSFGQSRNRAADDGAGFEISENLDAQLRSLNQEQRNVFDGICVLQIADGSLELTDDDLSRMRTLALQASFGALADVDRARIQAEFERLRAGIDITANTTEFNGRKLLDGSLTTRGISFPVGTENTPADAIEITVGAATGSSLGINEVSVSTASNAQKALFKIDAAIQKVSTARSHLGAIFNRFQSAVDNLSVAAEKFFTPVAPSLLGKE
jgi:flagellin